MLLFGHSAQLRVFVDPQLLQFDKVWAAAKTWNDNFGTAPDNIVYVVGGVVTDPQLSVITVKSVSGQYEITAVGIVRSSRSQPDDDSWDEETSCIELLTPFDARSVMGLDGFSHCIVVYVFDKATWDESKMSRHPRGNKDWPEVGIFAQRAKDRPNRLGVTVCQIVKVDGSIVHVAGLDAIDGTPVVDIKPWMEEFGPRGDTKQPSWASELMKDYW